MPVTIVASFEQMITEDDEPYLGVLVHLLYTDNQQIRDRGSYHISFISPREYLTIPPTILEGPVGEGGSVEMVSVGVAESAGDGAFFSSVSNRFFRGCAARLDLQRMTCM